MKIVADSNIIFSALISRKSLYLDVFRVNEIYMPDIVFYELNKYESRLIRKTKLKQEKFRMFVRMLFEEITIIPKFAISVENWKAAFDVCKNIDEKDTPFVALSLEFKIPLWTNDKKLLESFNQEGIIDVVTTDVLLENLN